MQELTLDPNKEWGMVIYSDGGARPNPGAIGVGIHGYFYAIDRDPKLKKMTRPEVTALVKRLLDRNPEAKAVTSLKDAVDRYIAAGKDIGFEVTSKPIKFTDGEIIKYAFPSETGYIYCSKDGEVSSSANRTAKPVTIEYYVEKAISSSNQHSNNYAELYGLFDAMKLARLHNVKKLFIYSDSKHALNSLFSWCKGWEAAGWVKRDGEVVSNLELTQAMYTEYLKALEENIEITGEWIKGHKGHPGNMEADTLASIGVSKSRRGIDDEGLTYFTFKEYQEPKRDRHPLMSLKRMYFNRDRARNIPGHYMMADPGDEDHLIGKPMAETVFAIVKMKEPIELIENIWDAQFRFGQDLDRIMMMKMENIYSPDVYRLIMAHKEYSLSKDLRSTGLMAMEKRPVTFEKNPVGITMRAIDSINSLEGILEHYTALTEDEGFNSNNIEMVVHDLTSDFYEVVEKKVGKEVIAKKSFVKTIAPGQKTHGVTLQRGEKTYTLPLKFALDLPDRNSLKRLETSDPIVQLITWRDSSASFRYASVIRCNEGIAIWSNFYADRILLKPEDKS